MKLPGSGADSCALIRILAVPLEGSTKALFKCELRSMSQQLNRSSGVGLRVTYVASAPGTILRIQSTSGNALQCGPHFVQRVPVAVASVEHHPGHARSIQRLHNQVRYVFDISEVARLLAIAVNEGSRLLQDASHEDREHAGVRARGVLPRTEDVEKPQRDGFQSVAALKTLAYNSPRTFCAAYGDLGRASIVSTFGSTSVSPYADEEPAKTRRFT